MNKKVSIIIPFYNSEKFLNNCVFHLKQQTYNNFEVIFVDDGSNDNSSDVLATAIGEDSHFVVLKRAEHTDPFQCRKAGFLASTGDIIVFLDADDELIPEACEIIASKIQENDVDMFLYGSNAIGDKYLPPNSLLTTQKYLDKQLFCGKKEFNVDYLLQPNFWTIAVWNKALKREALQKAYEMYVPKENMSYEQDVVQMILVFLSITSVYSDTTLKLHRYSLGTGATDKSTGKLEWNKFVRIAGAAKTVNAIKEIFDIYKDRFGENCEQIKRKICDNIFVNTTSYIKYLPQEDIPRGVDYMFNQWGASIFASPFFSCDGIKNNKSSILSAKCFSNRKRDIKTIALYYPHVGVGGVQSCLCLYSKLFPKAGFKVCVITDKPVEEEDKNRFAPGTYFTSLITNVEETPALNLDERCRRLAEILQEENIDVVHYSAYASKYLPNDMLVIRAMKAYCVVHLHSCFSAILAIGNPKLFSENIVGYGLSDAMVALSNENKKFLRALGVNSFYFPNPPSFDKEISSGPRNAPQFNRIVWCGRISREKQPLEAIKIFASAKKRIPNLKMAIVGDCVPASVMIKTKAIELAQNLDCYDAIEWTGFVKDVRPYLKESDILLSTSELEGYPMTIIEAFAFGMPCVSYELPCVEIVKSPKAVKSVRQFDVDQAVNNIGQLLTNKELYKESSEAAYEEYRRCADFDQLEAWKSLFLSLPNNSFLNNNTQTEDESYSLILSTLINHIILCEKRILEKEKANHKKTLQCEQKSMRKKMYADAKIVKVAIGIQSYLNKIIDFIIKFLKKTK